MIKIDGSVAIFNIYATHNDLFSLELYHLTASYCFLQAKALHKEITRAEGEKYDLEKRSKALQIDVSGLLLFKASIMQKSSLKILYLFLFLYEANP